MTDPTQDPHHNLRKQLKFRAWHRGTREMDFLLGSFANKYADGFDAEQLKRLDEIIRLPDPDLYRFKTGRDPVPEDLQNDVMLLLMAHKYVPTESN